MMSTGIILISAITGKSVCCYWIQSRHFFSFCHGSASSSWNFLYILKVCMYAWAFIITSRTHTARGRGIYWLRHLDFHSINLSSLRINRRFICFWVLINDSLSSSFDLNRKKCLYCIKLARKQKKNIKNQHLKSSTSVCCMGKWSFLRQMLSVSLIFIITQHLSTKNWC